jgi:hypothetical protein
MVWKEVPYGIWMSSKVKNIVTDTITKAEYMTALVAAKEGICVERFVIKLGVVQGVLVLWRSIV